MTNEKIILTDCDGVLTDWELRFHEWMDEKGYTANPSTLGAYLLHDVYDIEKAESKRLIREFNESSAMLSLPVFRDARTGVARLVDAGYKFIVVTSLSNDPNSQKLRKMNLENIFGKDVFVDFVFLDTGGDKDEALLPWKDSGLVWVEDKDENCLVGADLGLDAVLIAHGHNEHVEDERVTRLPDWSAIADYVLSK